jgi:hypothetical protein
MPPKAGPLSRKAVLRGWTNDGGFPAVALLIQENCFAATLKIAKLAARQATDNSLASRMLL